MSGAQGAHAVGTPTPTAYESVEGARAKTDIRSAEDDRGIQVEKVQDKVENPVGNVDPTAFAAKEGEEEEEKDDTGITGTA